MSAPLSTPDHPPVGGRGGSRGVEAVPAASSSRSGVLSGAADSPPPDVRGAPPVGFGSGADGPVAPAAPLTFSTAAARARASDGVAVDHLPCCPRCAELNDAAATECALCGAQLRWVCGWCANVFEPTGGRGQPAKFCSPLCCQRSNRAAKPSCAKSRLRAGRYWTENFTADEIRKLAGEAFA